MTFEVHKNERREVRRKLSMACRVVRESDYKLLGTRAIDVSPDGILVMTIRDAAAGERVLVSFKATELGIWFDAQGTIARVVHGRRPGDQGRCVAVRFANLDPVRRFILRGCLKRASPPLPQREPRIDYAATVRRIAANG
jgi:hypothetical protein